MARKRFITSDMCTDEKIAILAEENPTAALMWPWMVTALDDWGRMGANPMEVKLTVFPAFPFTAKEVAEAIKLYDQFELAHHYIIDDKPYLAVNPSIWYKYQTYIDSKRKEKQASKYPAPLNPPWAEENQQQLATIADIEQPSAEIVPSPSPSPSPLKEKEYVGPGQAETDDVVSDIFEFYCKTLGIRRRLTKGRIQKIKTRLTDFSANELKQAIVNLAADDFIMGKNDRNKFYAEIEYVFRSTEKTEQWINAGQRTDIDTRSRNPTEPAGAKYEEWFTEGETI
ncbi:MAG: hypothetical protein M0021_09580 [Clostridia bacterium]|nr:hypothetical protein [Clostridia bacterium]